MNVWIVRNAGTAGEAKWAVTAGDQGDMVLVLGDVDVKRGDWLTSDTWRENRVAERVREETDMSGRVIGRNVKVMPLSEWLEQHEAQSGSVQQNVYGNVGTMAGRDVLQSNTTIMTVLSALEKAVEEAEIPAEEKASLLSKIRDLINNPWISSVGTGLIVEVLKKAAGGE